MIRSWIADCSDLVCVRRQVRLAASCTLCRHCLITHPSQFGETPAAGRVAARLEAAMHTPSMLLLDTWDGPGARLRGCICTQWGPYAIP